MGTPPNMTTAEPDVVPQRRGGWPALAGGALIVGALCAAGCGGSKPKPDPDAGTSSPEAASGATAP